MPGSRDPVGGGSLAIDEGRGTLLPGAAEGTGSVKVVQGGDGGYIDVRAHEDTTWVSGRGDMELDNLIHGGITVDIPHDLPAQGRPVELPG